MRDKFENNVTKYEIATIIHHIQSFKESYLILLINEKSDYDLIITYTKSMPVSYLTSSPLQRTEKILLLVSQ